MASDAMATGRMLTLALLLTSGALAAEPDEKTKAAARQLAQDGARAFELGHHAEARDLLHRAYELVPAPTIALLEGRALEKMGRLVEAAERFEVARRTQLDPDASDAFKKAVSDAERELPALRARIPHLTIELRGVERTHPALRVELDGAPVPPELIGVRRPIDPGEHQVVARTGTDDASRTVTLKEREHQRVVLELSAPPPPAAPPRPDAPAEREDPGAAQRTWGYVGLGVGTAGIATGVVAGLIMLDKKSALDEVCTPACPSEAEDDVNAFRTARTVSLIGYIAGSIGLGVGAVLLLTAPSDDAPAVGMSPWLSGDGLGLGVSGGFR